MEIKSGLLGTKSGVLGIKSGLLDIKSGVLEVKSVVFPNISSCAASCAGISTMFVYARMDGPNCKSVGGFIVGCECRCENQSKNDGTCDMKDNEYWDLFSLPMNNKSKCDRFLHNDEDDASTCAIQLMNLFLNDLFKQTAAIKTVKEMKTNLTFSSILVL